MPSTYTTNGGIELIATGEQSGTWGDTTNENLEIIDRLTNGVGTITLSGTTHTLTTSNGALSDGQYAVLVFAGSPSGTNTVTITPNTNQHVYIVRNTTAQSVVLTQGSGGDVTIATNKSAIVYANGAGAGAAVVDVTSTFNFGAGTVTSVATGTGLTGGPITGTGTVSVATNGITDTLLRDSSALSVIGRSANSTGDPADISAGTDHQVLRRSGTTLGFGAIALNQSAAVTGTLAVTNGGTGITSFGTGVATWLGTPSSANLAAAVTDETGSGALVFGTKPTITGLVESNSALGTGSGTQTFNLNNGNYFTLTTNGTTTLAVSNVPASGSVGAFIVQLTNGGGYTINYFSGITWAGGTPPTLTTTGTDVLGFFTTDGGTTWRGLVLALDIKAP